MDLFDDIEDSTGINEKTPFFQLVEKNLPPCDIILISETGERMVSRQSASFVDTVFETALWEKTKQADHLIFSANKNDSFVCAWYLEKMQCLLVCAFADEFDLFSVKKMISPMVMLCAEVCYKDKLLAEEKENLVVHKQQRDRKINVLEKKYADILIENQRQSAEYSKLLHSEIQRQTAELKRSNKALRLAKKKAEAANLSKDAFLANMSHEIRTPMNSVLGFLELSLEDPLIHERLQQNLSIAYRSARGLLSLINDILDISKLERKKLILENQPFRLAELIEKIFATLKIEAQKKELFLEYQIDPSVSNAFSGDSFRIQQVMINLIGNGIKFTEHGSVILKVLPGKKKNQLHFMIHDTGIGIAPDRLDKLFDPFEQADMSTTRRYGGTGLGTAISKQIIELMGGQIWAESEQGKGSVFHFVIPIESVDDAMLEPCEEIPESGRKKDRSFRILMAEDTDTNAVLVKTRLEHQGHMIKRVCNGREAVDVFKKDEFDIILMDIHMPEMDGLEAAKQIRSLQKDEARQIPIIALTASVMGDEVKKFIAAGMNTVVAKPIDFGHLSQVMDKLVPGNKGSKNLEKKKQSVSEEAETKDIKGVDYHAGMARWQNQDIYEKALIDFAGHYKDFSERFVRCLDAGGVEKAFQETHTLKGLAGNLSILKVADLAENIHSALRRKDIETARKELILLAAELRSVVASVRTLAGIRTEKQTVLKTSDPGRLKRLIQQIMDAFDHYSPDLLKPLVQELQTCIAPEQLKPVLQYSEDLDYDRAKNEFMKLVKLLDLN